uniref:BTB domain-containing protein n=1 Tax=Panagrolaimus sp. ES5 TaxID=591445 RepID=A0AC34FH91_9BILA
MGDPHQVEKFPFSLRWTIPRKDVENYKRLETQECIANSFATYSLQLRVFETLQDERGLTEIYFYVNPMNIGGVTAKISISIPNLGKTHNGENHFDSAYGMDFYSWGTPICTTDFFLKENSPAFVDGKFVVEVKGMFIVNSCFWKFRISQNEIGSNILDHGEKDFALVINGQELKVHKLVLTSCSDVLADMVKVVDMKEEENNRLEIDNEFDYDVVQAAIMYCYQENGYINDTNITEVCKFADKFELKGFKKKIIDYMSINISPMNVGQFFNAAHYLQASKLERKCMEFLRQCVKHQTAVAIDDLDPELAKKFINYLCCTNIDTRNVA